MDEEISTYFFLSLREINRSILYGLEGDINIFLYNLYVEYIKVKSIYETESIRLKKTTKRYKVVIGISTVLLATLICTL